MTVYKNKAISFGGVYDIEGSGHVISSTFYHELYAFDLERKRWYQLGLRSKHNANKPEKAAAEKPTGAGDDGRTRFAGDYSDTENINAEHEKEVSENDEERDEREREAERLLEEANQELFGYIDEHGNVIYVHLDEEEGEQEGVEGIKEIVVGLKQHALSEKVAEILPAESSEAISNSVADIVESRATTTSRASAVALVEPQLLNNNTTAKIAIKQDEDHRPLWQKFLCDRQDPCPRINPCIMIRGNALVIYGGVTEIGDVEVTLDDCWSLDLNKRDRWKNILTGSMHTMVWKGVEDDDDESSRRTGKVCDEGLGRSVNFTQYLEI
jgi:hypothetical protein